MQEITKIIISVIVGLFGSGIVYSIFKFIILNYFKKITKNEDNINKLDKRLLIIENELGIKKSPE